MDRKQFIKNSILGAGGLIIPGQYSKSINMIGLNHINIKQHFMDNSVLHKANTRGVADLGWLNSRHTFSFSHYYNQDRMNFGVLRVLNDDIVAPGMGFGKHPHSNMEIISIPLEGDLQHQDSIGNQTIIKKGDIQIMSAGTGVEHSEYNNNKDQEVKFLQIWVIPNKQGTKPRYDQITLNPADRENKLQQILSPNQGDEGVWINQDAWFHLGKLEKDVSVSYDIRKKGNGVYIFVLAGDVSVNGQELNLRDGFGIWDIEKLEIKSLSESEILMMEVPMTSN